MLEHIEFAGVHSGDAAMVLPPHSFRKRRLLPSANTRTRWRGVESRRADERAIRREGRDRFTCWKSTRAPRAPCRSSRKAIGRPLAKLAAKVMAGKTLKELGFTEEIWPKYWAVKESVFPFNKLSRPGHFALAGNALDRRSHGPGRRPRHCLREIADGGQFPAAHGRQGVHQRQRHAQKTRRRRGEGLREPGI
jgi:hypothetical protein